MEAGIKDLEKRVTDLESRIQSQSGKFAATIKEELDKYFAEMIKNRPTLT